MKKVRKKIIRVLIIAMLLQIAVSGTQELNIDLTNAEDGGILDEFSDLLTGETVTVDGQDYGSLFSTDAEIISRINYACSLYPPGAYFSKNGKACTCHGLSINHVNSPSNCNCLRYVKINGSTVDLMAVQCFGYAMFMQMCILGTTQFKSPSSFTMIYGSNNTMTGVEMERFFVEHASVIHPGTHMRCRYSCHSLVIMAIDYANGKITYIDNNMVGNCKISSFTTMTWDQFAARYHNINYIAVYKNFYSMYSGAPDAALIAEIQKKMPTPTPTKRPATPTPSPSPANYSIGLYRVTAKPHLNLREDTYTSSNKISELPYGMEVEIFDFAYNKGGHHWGLIDTEEGSGWSSMGYLELICEYTPTPTPTYIAADYDTGTYKVTATTLMVRERQTKNSGSLGKLSKDTIADMMIFVQGDDGLNWGYVTLEDLNLQGWVCMDYMQIIPTSTPTPTISPTATPATTHAASPTQITDKTPTPGPSDKIDITPTPAASNENSEPVGRTITVICIILVCIAGEAFVFIILKKRRNKKVKSRQDSANKGKT